MLLCIQCYDKLSKNAVQVSDTATLSCGIIIQNTQFNIIRQNEFSCPYVFSVYQNATAKGLLDTIILLTQR